MAKLNPSLILTMTKDLIELYQIGHEMMNFIGQCNIMSWKYPNQFIKDIEINIDKDVFDTYEKYILLLELIIDRLYLILNIILEVLHSVSKSILSKTFGIPKNVCRQNGISFGTLTALIWKRLCLLINNKQLDTSSSSLENYNESISDSNVEIKCEKCIPAMCTIRQILKKLEDYIKTTNIESAIAKQKCEIGKYLDKMNQTQAMQQWCDVIFCDVDNIMLYARNKNNQNQHLKQDLATVQKTHNENLKDMESLKTKISELESQIKAEKLKFNYISEEKNNVLSKYNAAVDQLTKSDEICIEKEESIKKLENKLSNTKVNNESNFLKMKSQYAIEISVLKSEIDKIHERYNKSLKNIDELNHMVITKEENVTKLEETIQNIILEHNKANEEQAELNKKLLDKIKELENQIEKQKNDFIVKVKNIAEEKIKLEKDLKIYKEKEIILLTCPDLNGPIIYSKGKQNPLQDMQDQFRANDLRMKLLNEQNVNLQRTIDRMKSIMTSGELSRN